MKMRIPLATMAITFLAMCATAGAQTAPVTQPGRSVSVSMNQKVVALGQSIPVNIIYHNRDDLEWRIARPDTTLGTHVKYMIAAEKDERYAKGYSLGRVSVTETVLPSGQIMTAQIAPTEVDVRIKPGEDYTFATDLEAMWAGHLRPGDWLVWFTDEKQIYEAPRVRFRVEFTKDSVPAMLAIVGDAERHPYQRKWNAQWLAKLREGFALKLPVDGEVETDADVKTREAVNQAVIADFRAWWDKNKDTPAVERQVREISERSERETLAEQEQFRAARSVK